MFEKILGTALLVGLAGVAIDYVHTAIKEEKKRKNTPLVFPPYMSAE